MKKVHVVFKTHLDLGFTDLASNVLENYNNNYIPRAVEMAFELNQSESNPKFIWTTGSYLIWQYLESQDSNKTQRLIEAIENGYISWHGLPVTFHSESAGKLVLEHALNITKELDLRFGKNTISAKMTDVPGHTKAIVPLLENNGIKFLHIGMNGVSAIPQVPESFIWQCGESKIIVAYSYDYGTDIKIKGCEDVLVFAHTHDNSGPQSKEKILKVYEQLEKKYPEYEICASTIDEYVRKLDQSELELPIISEEIGDTWIHGIASDPHKMRKYNTLVNLIELWLEEGELNTSDDNFKNIIYNLMLVPEHTWGMDIKRYFSDYKNYSKLDFNQAREANKILDDALTFRYRDIKDATEPEMKYTSFEWEDRSYELYEKSWTEQHQYIDNAVDLLPQKLKTIYENKINQQENYEGIRICPYQEVSFDNFKVQINECGAISSLLANGTEYASDSNQLFKLQYTVLGNDSYEKFRSSYLRDLDKHFWGIDFLKPGIELQNEVISSKTFNYYTKSIKRERNKLVVELYKNSEASEKFGAPRKLTIIYTFTDQIEVKVRLESKDASRYPEIISLGINPLVNNHFRYVLEKLGTEINPFDIVGNGSKIMHSIDKKIKYNASDKKFEIIALDSRVLSLGQIDNLDFKPISIDPTNGFYFHLLNTTWGTNFTMWYEEDIEANFSFKIK